MAGQGTRGLGANNSRIDDRCFTTLCLTGSTNTNSVLEVFGNANIGGGLTIGSDIVVQGNLTVNGFSTFTNAEQLRVFDKVIFLADTSDMISSDGNANGAGIIVRGTTNKSILWSDANDRWDFNQDINLGTYNSDSGTAYQINGNEVLTATSLGNNVISSNLQEVGVLSKGSISHICQATSILSGTPTTFVCEDHGFSSGETVIISGANSTPAPLGCFVITKINNDSFTIPFTTTIGGTTANIKGSAFPIDIGVSSLDAGDITTHCGHNLRVTNGPETSDVLIVRGSDQTINMWGSANQPYMTKIEGRYLGNFTSDQRSLWVVNTANNINLNGRSRALHATNRYYGTNTSYNTKYDTLQLVSGYFDHYIAPQTPLVKATATGVDTNSQQTQEGVNIGLMAEANNAVQANIGVNGLSNTGILSLGVSGIVNRTRQQLASDCQANWIDPGGFRAGVFGYNPVTASDNNYAIYGIGNIRLEGDTEITGDLNLTGCLSASDICSSLIPNLHATYDLGSSDQRWRNLYISGTIHACNIQCSSTLTLGSDSTSVNIGGPNTTITTINGPLTVTSDLTAGDTTINGDLTVSGSISGTFTIINSREAITASGGSISPSISVNTTELTITSNTSGTLADGSTFGQEKRIMVVSHSGGVYTLSVTTSVGPSSYAFDTVNQGIILQWTPSGWCNAIGGSFAA